MFLTLPSDGNQVITCAFVNEADIVVDKNKFTVTLPWKLICIFQNIKKVLNS